MKTIVFIPHSQVGHINPTFKLAKNLKRLGYKVCYLGFQDHEEYVRAQGLDFVPIFKELCPKGFVLEQAEKGVDHFGTILDAARKADPETKAKIFMEIQHALKSSGADLVIIDFVLKNLSVLAQQIGIPSVLISITIVEGHTQLIEQSAEQFANSPVLALCPPDFEFPQVVRSRQWHYIEASIDLERKSQPFCWDKVDKSKPLIFCSFGNHTHLYENIRSFLCKLVEAMRTRQDLQLILAIGAYLNVSDFHDIPPNVLVVNTAPQLEVLERASLMITHGGLGSVKECIYFGVPMVVFPVTWDQPGNAARVVYHGLGVRGNLNDVSVEKIQHALDRAHNDPSFKIRVMQMRDKFREMECSGTGVRIIEQALAHSERTRSINISSAHV